MVQAGYKELVAIAALEIFRHDSFSALSHLPRGQPSKSRILSVTTLAEGVPVAESNDLRALFQSSNLGCECETNELKKKKQDFASQDLSFNF